MSAIARPRPDYGSGLANVYEWSAPGAATVRTPNAPYTTRMLVIFCRSDYEPIECIGNLCFDIRDFLEAGMRFGVGMRAG